MDIAIDFDGTCVTHDFPAIGQDIGATHVLKALVKAGHCLILNTMRSDCMLIQEDIGKVKATSGAFLSEAVEWFEDRSIPLYGINQNPDQVAWTQSPKVSADLYIDDAALGIPLIHTVRIKEPWDVDFGPPHTIPPGNIPHARPYVDWKGVEEMLYKLNIIHYSHFFGNNR